MRESKFEILTTTKDVIGKLKDYLKEEDIKKIDVYCSDFESYGQKHPTSLAFQIYLLLLRKVYLEEKIDIQVYNSITFSHQSLMDSLNKKETKKEVGEKDGSFFVKGIRGIPTEILREMQDMVASYLNPIAQEANQRKTKQSSTDCANYSYLGCRITPSLKNQSFESLSDMVNTFLENSPDLNHDLELISHSLIKLQEKIKNQFNSIWMKEKIDNEEDKITKSINIAFETLQKNIKLLAESGREYELKITIKFFIQVIPAIIDIFSKGGVSLSWIDFLQSSVEYVGDLSDFYNNKYFYSIMLVLYQLFVQEIAPIFTLIARNSLKNTIHIHTTEKTYFIDYSGCNIDAKNCSIFTHFNCAFAGEYNHKINSPHHQASSFSLTLLQEESIEEKIKSFLSTLNPRINFLCSPYFTSYKLTHWLQESTTQTLKGSNNKIGANYFILTQCPTKLKAGMSEEIIKRLGYEIKDEINRSSQLPKLTQKPTRHNPVVDYSKYEIKINAKDNAPFVLSLSPFGIIAQSKYKEMENKKEELKNLNWGGINGEINSQQLRNNIQKEEEYTPFVNALNYIQTFFQSNNDIDAFLKKDKELFAQQIALFKNFFHLLGKEKDLGNAGKISIYHPHHIILMALIFQTLEENYKTKISYNFSKESSNQKEVILIEENKIEVTPFRSILYANHNSQKQNSFDDIYLCYSKEKRKDIPSNKQVFCIQDFAEKIFQDTSSSSIQPFYNLHFEGKTPSTPQEKDKEKELILCYLLAIKSMIPLFPFISSLSPYKNLNKRILKAMLDYPVLLEAFYHQIVCHFSLHALQKKVAKEMQTLTKENHTSFNWDEFINDEIKNFIFNDIQSLGDLLLNKQELQNLAEEYSKTSSKQIKEKLSSSFKSYASSHIKSSALNLLIAGIDKNWVTQYEQQKKAYETLLYSKFIDKNDAPLALKREEGVYYPIGINQTFLSFSFQNLILGGEFCTGGLGYLKSEFYLLQETTSGQSKNKNTQENFNIVRNYQLNLLFALLCLDELRNANIGERVEDEIFLKQNHSRKEFGNYVLNTENQAHKAVYKSYGGGSGEDDGNNQADAIDSYQVIMQYFDDIKNGIFDSNQEKNTPNSQKHRVAIRALDNIGKNNIRGLYVGISQKKDNEQRPKLIGRLATTIIMKDGLWLG